MNRSKLRESVGKRFRFDPPAVEVDGTGNERVVPNVYICERVDHEGMYFSGAYSPSAPKINFDQVKERLSNPTPGAQTLHDAEAILLLKVQVVYTPRGLEYRPIRFDAPAGQRRHRRADRSVVIPIAGTQNKIVEAFWIVTLGLLVIGALKAMEARPARG
jgi:hypothetical protein